MRDHRWGHAGLTNIQAAACPMDREMAPQFISSDEVDMVAEAESDCSRGGDEVSISEELHPFQISIDIQKIPGEIDSTIWIADRQWREERP
jgi:hypothetical protein